MFSVVVLLLVILILLSIYDYIRNDGRRISLIKNFPGDFPLPFFGNALQIGFNTDEVTENLMKTWRKYGMGNYRVTMGTEDWVMIVNPADVDIILSHPTELAKPTERNAAMVPFFGNSISTATGKKWRSTRKLVGQSFHYKTLDQKLSAINAYSDRLIKIFEDQYVDNGPVELYTYIKPYMYDLVCMSLMGVNYNMIDQPHNPYFRTIENVHVMLTDNWFSYWRKITPLFVLSPTYKKMQKAIKLIQSTSEMILSNRKTKLNKEKAKNNNLIEKSEEKLEDDKEIYLLDKFIQSTLPNGEPVPDYQIKEEISLISFTAHYTTTLTMANSLYQIAKHPEVQRHVLEEQWSIFHGDRLRDPTSDDLSHMKYLEAAIKEAMRLIPTVTKIGRQLYEDLVLSDGRIAPRGSSVIIFFEAMQADPKLFPEPEKYNPDRFLDRLVPYSFVPFSGGPRNCIGAGYAWMTMKATISKLIRRYELHEGGPGLEPQFAFRMLTESKNGIHIKLKRRVQ